MFTNSDVKSYMDYDTFEKRVSDIEKTLFESQDMNEAPWKLSREWCVNVGDKDRDSTREALKNLFSMHLIRDSIRWDSPRKMMLRSLNMFNVWNKSCTNLRLI